MNSRTVPLILILLMVASLGGIAGGQQQTLKLKYRDALARAQAKDFERAYDMAFKLVREDESYYDAQVLRIALAGILGKSGSESPKNLIRIANNFAPLGSNLERDVETLANRLSSNSVVSVEPPGGVSVSPYVHKKIALIVGIGSFMDPKVNPLNFTSNDAEAFADTLTQDCRFDDVRVLINAKATRRNILLEIERIAQIAQPDDLVVFYVATHGSPEDMDSAGVSYIVTYDSEVENLFGTAYKMKDLLEDLQTRIRSQRVVAFVDTCFSGATFKEKPSKWVAFNRGLSLGFSGLPLESIEAQLKHSGRSIRLGAVTPSDGRREQGIGRIIIASSRQSERAWESDSIKHGYFTYYLIQLLKREKEVSIQNLFDYVSVEVPRAVMRDRNAQQNPTMASSVEGPVRIYIK